MEIVIAAVALGLLAGVAAGFFGVGGGILFVPTLVLAFELGPLEAAATSLAAILPTVAAGAWRQHRYGNVRWRTAATLGVVAVVGVELGVRVADALDEDVLRRLFALLLFGVAAQVALRALRS
ncbi:MAG: sulfite exporter TauE/SafE family protein [Actinomycetota bacterium]|nr:sulfite exporter TauE/SafE family protein [Actinomycetota bacterium]